MMRLSTINENLPLEEKSSSSAQSLKKIIVGCGNRHHTSAEYSVCSYHRESYETMDRMQEKDCFSSDPTFKLDINNFDYIQKNFEKSSYQLIIFERVPFNYRSYSSEDKLDISGCQKNGALSCGHLLNETGMLAFIGCGFLEVQLVTLSKNMLEAGFNTLFFHDNGSCFFFKCDVESARKLYDKYIKEDRYINKLTTAPWPFTIPSKLYLHQLSSLNKLELSVEIKESDARLERANQNIAATSIPPKKIVELMLGEIHPHLDAKAITNNSYKVKLITMIFNCFSVTALKELQETLQTSASHDFLRVPKGYSHYETLIGGKIVPARKTWAQIEQAISIQTAFLLVKNQAVVSQKLVEENYAFIKRGKKRNFLFFRPRSSETYDILIAKEQENNKLEQLKAKQSKLQATL